MRRLANRRVDSPLVALPSSLSSLYSPSVTLLSVLVRSFVFILTPNNGTEPKKYAGESKVISGEYAGSGWLHSPFFTLLCLPSSLPFFLSSYSEVTLLSAPSSLTLTLCKDLKLLQRRHWAYKARAGGSASRAPAQCYIGLFVSNLLPSAPPRPRSLPLLSLCRVPELVERRGLGGLCSREPSCEHSFII